MVQVVECLPCKGKVLSSQLRKIKTKTKTSKTKLGVVAHTCGPSYSGGRGSEVVSENDIFSENKQNIRTKSLALVAEALSSIPSIAKKKDKKQNKNLRPLNQQSTRSKEQETKILPVDHKG
jgi:hypothetical protein